MPPMDEIAIFLVFAALTLSAMALKFIQVLP